MEKLRLMKILDSYLTATLSHGLLEMSLNLRWQVFPCYIPYHDHPSYRYGYGYGFKLGLHRYRSPTSLDATSCAGVNLVLPPPPGFTVGSLVGLKRCGGRILHETLLERVDPIHHA